MTATHDIDEDALVKFCADYIEEIKRINDTLSLDAAVQWQG